MCGLTLTLQHYIFSANFLFSWNNAIKKARTHWTTTKWMNKGEGETIENSLKKFPSFRLLSFLYPKIYVNLLYTTTTSITSHCIVLQCIQFQLNIGLDLISYRELNIVVLYTLKLEIDTIQYTPVFHNLIRYVQQQYFLVLYLYMLHVQVFV
jgi:hypothetical protein